MTTCLTSLFVACLYILNVAYSFTHFVSISYLTFLSSIYDVFSLSGKKTMLLITTQIVLFYTLINIGFEHFLCSNRPN